MVYVLSWYLDGSGQPAIRFFDDADAVEIARYAVDMKAEGQHVEVAYVTETPKEAK